MELYVARNGQRLGPFPLEEVQRRVAAGEFSPLDLAWAEGRSDWAPLTSVLPATPPPLAVGGPPPLGAGSTPPPYASSPSSAQFPDLKSAPTPGSAIASLVCGVISWTFLPFLMAIPAIICGHVARSAIKKSEGRLSGGGVALAGLITGYLNIALLPVIAILAAIAIPAFLKAKERSERLRDSITQSVEDDALLNETGRIADACHAYASDHDGNFPPKLADLFPKYLDDAKLQAQALSTGLDYEYFGGKVTDDEEKVLLRSKGTSKGNKHVVAYVNTNVDYEEEELTVPLPVEKPAQ